MANVAAATLSSTSPVRTRKQAATSSNSGVNASLNISNLSSSSSTFSSNGASVYRIHEYTDQARHISLSPFISLPHLNPDNPKTNGTSTKTATATHSPEANRIKMGMAKLLGSFDLLEQVEMEKRDWRDAMKSLHKRGELRTTYDMSLLLTLARRLKVFSDPSIRFTNEELEEALRFSSMETSKVNDVICEVDYPTKKPQYFYVVLKGSISLTSSQYPASYKAGKRNSGFRTNSDYTAASPRSNFSYKNICSFFTGDAFGGDLCNDEYAKEGLWKWVANEESDILRIPTEVYNNTIKPKYEKELKSRVSFLKNLVVPVFGNYKPSILYELAKSFFVQHLPSRHTIIKQGRPGNMMYFIKSGEVAVLRRLKFQDTIGVKTTEFVRFVELSRLKQKEYFGERVLLACVNDNPNESKTDISISNNYCSRLASIYTTTETILYCINRTSFSNFFNKEAITKMQKYADTYPREKEIRKVFAGQQEWQKYKSKLLREIIEKPKPDEMFSPRSVNRM